MNNERSKGSNDARSRSLNQKDPVGRAAAENHARQVAANEADSDDESHHNGSPAGGTPSSAAKK